MSHQLALIMSLPFVHTARRPYRLNDPVNNLDGISDSLLGSIDYQKLSKPYQLEEG